MDPDPDSDLDTDPDPAIFESSTVTEYCNKSLTPGKKEKKKIFRMLAVLAD
jgi:hypothetical protein